MNPSIRLRPIPDFDDPWRRLPWLVPAALLTWALLLIGFAKVLEQTAPPPAELKPIEARIIEVPVGGLQAAPAPAIARHPAEPVHHARPKPREVRKELPKKIEPPPIPTSPEGTLKSKEAAPAAPEAASSGESAGPAGSGLEGGSGSGGISGSDSVGARAIYSPVPKIPDDLREQVFQAEAVAHFTVSYDGTVKVTLTKPTPNPRLNQILLDTLSQWRFFPAVREGVAIDSVFDVRIPISVQ